MAQVGLGEHLIKHVALFNTDSMLSGDGSTHFETGLENILRTGNGSLGAVFLVRVIENQRVDISVAGVAHMGYTDPMAFSNPVGCLQYVCQLIAGHHTIVGVEGRGDLA